MTNDWIIVRQVEKIQHPGPDEKSGGQKEDSGEKNAAIRQIGDKKRNEERDGKNQKRGHAAVTVNGGEEVT